MSVSRTIRVGCAAMLVWTISELSGLCEKRQVLVLYDERTELPGLAMIDAGITEVLASAPDGVEIYREAMDNSRFDSPAYRNHLHNYLQAKYASKRIDVAVAVMGPALDFLLSHRATLFATSSEVPIVFCGIDRRTFGDRPLPPGVTGVLLKREFAPTLELALRLHPATERIVVIAGTSDFDTSLLKQAREEFRMFENRLPFTYSTEKPLRELLSELSRLPPHTLLLYTTMFRDGANQPHVPHEVVERISAAANAPVYGFVDQYLGRGIVGGQLYRMGAHGEAAGQLVLKILAGISPAGLSPIEPETSVTMFDWRQLERWNINEDRLPAGSLVQFREPTFWERYKWRVVFAASAVCIQAAIISILVANLIKRRRAERSLAETETRFRIAANTAPVMIWMSGPDKLCTFFNKEWLEFTGRTLEQESGNGWTEGVHPDDFSTCLQTYEKSFDARREFTTEYRLRKRDGDYAWVIDNGMPRFAADGAFLGYIGSATDITALKQAQERMTLAAEAAHLGMWVWDLPQNRLWTSERCKALFDYSPDEEMSLEKLQARVHPDDLEMCDSAVRDALAGTRRYNFEYRLRLPNQSVRWVSASGRVDRDERGQAVRMLGIAIDITERKQAEEAAREVSGKLITAQEDERKRIARDLHDDLNQRLALLSVETDMLGQMENNGPAQTLINDIAAQVRDLSSEVHKLSYQLHPAKLDQLGLVSATRSFCHELSKQCGVPVDFIHDDIPRDLNRGVALCLYRIVQEGLQNMVKHSRATHARVELRQSPQELRLLVSDNGQGFDMQTVGRHAGLGLVGMRERVRLVHGRIAFQSTPGEGTHIEVTVPMALTTAMD